MRMFNRCLLVGLDLLFSFRHVPKRVILGSLAGISLATLLLVGLIAVAQVGGVLQSLRTLTGDIGTSLTATREMRTALFDFRRDLLYSVIDQQPPDPARIDRFRASSTELVRLYRSGSFLQEERATSEQLAAAQSHLDEQLAALKQTPYDPAALLAADRAAQPLSDLLRDSGRVNSQRLDQLTIDLEQKLRFGIVVTSLLSAVLLGFGIIGLGLLGFYIWLDRLEKNSLRL